MDLAGGTIDYSIQEVQRARELYTNKDDIDSIDDSLYHLRKARKSISRIQEDVQVLKTVALLMPYICLWLSQNTRAQKIQN